MLHQFRGWSLGRKEGSLLPSPLPHPSEAVGEEKKRKGGRLSRKRSLLPSFLLLGFHGFNEEKKKTRGRWIPPQKKTRVAKKKENSFFMVFRRAKKWEDGFRGKKYLASFFGPHAGLPLSFTNAKATTLPLQKIYMPRENFLFFYYGRLLQQIKLFLLPKIARPFNRSCPL